MEDNKYQIICELMDELKKEMQYSSDDIGERLGRKKPDVEVVKVEGDMPMEDEEMGEMADMDEMSESPGDSLKKRLMRLRG